MSAAQDSPATGTVIAVAAPGEMGSALGQRMARRGARVLTSLTGRGPASATRAAAAGMAHADDAELARARYFLSIVPPHAALATAERYAPALARSTCKAIYLDCNAISLDTTLAVQRVVEAAGARYVDASIIGFKGLPHEPGPTVYLAGEAPGDVEALQAIGLCARSTAGPVGAASALKMAYAGLNKGLTGLAAAMVLAASRAGAGQALLEEMQYSQPKLLAHVARTLPDMYAKAYRWDFEMREVARFAGDDDSVASLYAAMADFFQVLAQDWSGPKVQIGCIDAFLAARNLSLDRDE